MEYEVVYSGRKTVSLCIKNGGLIVRAPYGTSEERIREIIEKHRLWVTTHLEREKIKQSREACLSDEDVARLKKNAKEILPIKTAYYAKRMGIKYGRITITGAKTRFGSCSSKGNIAYSYRLMLYPEDAIDYVVVHELAHRVEMNHSKRFYDVIRRILPDYKRRAKLLKQY